MELSKETLVIVLLGALCTIAAGVVTLLDCDHDQYVSGTIQNPVCENCLICDPGHGLNYLCNNRVQFPNITFECVHCENETFSPYASTGMCDECSPECSHNEVEVKQCSPTENRNCECIGGIFEHGAHGQCTQECCHCLYGLRPVPKCQKDNIDGKLCEPPGTSGKCPLLLPTAPVTDRKKTFPTKMVGHSQTPAQNYTERPSTGKATASKPSTKRMSAQTSTEGMVNINYTTPAIVIKKNMDMYWLSLPVILLVCFMWVYLCYFHNFCRGRNRRLNLIDEGDCMLVPKPPPVPTTPRPKWYTVGDCMLVPKPPPVPTTPRPKLLKDTTQDTEC